MKAYLFFVLAVALESSLLLLLLLALQLLIEEGLDGDLSLRQIPTYIAKW